MDVNIGRIVLTILFLFVLVFQACKNSPTPVADECPDPDNPECALTPDPDLAGSWESERTCSGGGEVLSSLAFTVGGQQGTHRSETTDCENQCQEPNALAFASESEWTQVDENTLYLVQTYGEACGIEQDPTIEKNVDYSIDADTLFWDGNSRFTRVQN